jgi:hypothetical protein
MGHRLGHDPARGVDVAHVVALQVGREEGRVGGGVVDAAGLVQQLPHGDPPTVVAGPGDHAGQPLGHAAVQVEPVLGDQLEQHGGDEGLGVAGDPEPVVGPGRTPGGDVGEPGRGRGAHVAPAGVGDGGGVTVSDRLGGRRVQDGRERECGA